jgi:hypothetical protein
MDWKGIHSHLMIAIDTLIEKSTTGIVFSDQQRIGKTTIISERHPRTEIIVVNGKTFADSADRMRQASVKAAEWSNPSSCALPDPDAPVPHPSMHSAD